MEAGEREARKCSHSLHQDRFSPVNLERERDATRYERQKANEQKQKTQYLLLQEERRK